MRRPKSSRESLTLRGHLKKYRTAKRDSRNSKCEWSGQNIRGNRFVVRLSFDDRGTYRMQTGSGAERVHMGYIIV